MVVVTNGANDEERKEEDLMMHVSKVESHQELLIANDAASSSQTKEGDEEPL